MQPNTNDNIMQAKNRQGQKFCKTQDVTALSIDRPLRPLYRRYMHQHKAPGSLFVLFFLLPLPFPAADALRV